MNVLSSALISVAVTDSGLFSTIRRVWPARRITAAIRSDESVARPLMTAIEASAWSGSKPRAAPVSAATKALAALPRYAVGRIVEGASRAM